MRPRIVCHMVSSIDGRLLVGRFTPLTAGRTRKFAGACYESVAARFEADGFLIGRVSMQEFGGVAAQPPALAARAVSRPAHRADRGGLGIAAVVDPQAKLHFQSPVIDGSHVVTVLSEQVSDDYLAELRALGISYLFAGPDGLDMAAAMATLGSEFGIRTLLLEGGGRINGSFLKAGLIDEISLLVYPGIDGLAGVSSIFEYAGGPDERPAAGRQLRHFATETLEGGFVWLRYMVEDCPVAT